MKRSKRLNRLFSFKSKIFLTSALLNLVTICALSAIMYSNYSSSEAKSLEKQSASLLAQLVSSSDMIVRRLDEISMSIYADSTLNTDISRLSGKVSDNTQTDIDGILLEEIIVDRLKQYISTTEFVHSARLYMGTHAVYAGFTSEIIIPSQDTYRTLGFEDAAREADGRALVSPPYEQLSAQAGAPRTYKRLISYSRLLSDISVKHRKVPTAVLVLDGLSLRELPLIVTAGGQRGIEPVRVEVRGAEVPTETDRFAEAMGVASRSALYTNQAPSGFLFNGPDVYTDVLGGAFLDCVGSVPPKPRLFLWHKWPDEDLVHGHQEDKDGPALVAMQTKKTIHSDDFWNFVDRLRQGRRLVITGDHGYADASSFSNEEKNEDTVKLLRSFFGASRCAKEDPSKPWPRQHLPPLVCRYNGWLVVMGQRK